MQLELHSTPITAPRAELNSRLVTRWLSFLYKAVMGKKKPCCICNPVLESTIQLVFSCGFIRLTTQNSCTCFGCSLLRFSAADNWNLLQLPLHSLHSSGFCLQKLNSTGGPTTFHLPIVLFLLLFFNHVHDSPFAICYFITVSLLSSLLIVLSEA